MQKQLLSGKRRATCINFYDAVLDEVKRRARDKNRSMSGEVNYLLAIGLEAVEGTGSGRNGDQGQNEQIADD